MYQYSIINEDGHTRIAATDADVGYAEVQLTEEQTEEAIQSALTEFFEDAKAEKIYNENIQPDFTRNFKDDVYMNGSIVRTDYSADRDEALTNINALVSAFPQYTVEQLTADSRNVIGTYGNYRPPYNNNSISFYDFTKPTADTLAAYGCSEDVYGDDLLQWHGIKHDLVSGDISAKFVFTQNHGSYLSNLPTSLPPNRSIFFAHIHNSDGTLSEWVDVYIISTIKYMKQYCLDIGQNFPLPDDITEQPWCFSVVYNDDTGEINCVKAYIRHRYSDD